MPQRTPHPQVSGPTELLHLKNALCWYQQKPPCPGDHNGAQSHPRGLKTMSPLKEELCSKAFFNDNVFFSLIVERKEDVTSCVTLIFNHMFLLLLI